MPQNGRHPWIERLLNRGGYSCIEPKWAHFRQQLLRETILGAADENESGRERLRAAALEQLGDDDPYLIERALTCLFVVGVSSDVAAVNPLTSHEIEFVRKAARTCLVEIRRRRG
jgi:hypothetical protein